MVHGPLLRSPAHNAKSVARLAISPSTEIDYHFVREKVAHKQIDVRFIFTLDQVADIFTKGLASNRVRDLQTKLRVQQRPHQLEGG